MLPFLAGPGGALERQSNPPKQGEKHPKSTPLAEYRTKPAGRESKEIHGVWGKRKIIHSVTGGFAQTEISS